MDPIILRIRLSEVVSVFFRCLIKLGNVKVRYRVYAGKRIVSDVDESTIESLFQTRS